MSDIRKMIEHLKELEAKATQAPWVVGASVHGPDQAFVDWARGMVIRQLDTVDADLIVAMRNSLPELLQKLQELLPVKDENLKLKKESESV